MARENTYPPYLTFEGVDSDFDLNGNMEWDGIVEYSTDTTTWTVWDGSTISSSGKKLYLRGSGNTKFYTSNGARLSLSARAACSGNIQTLLEYSNPPDAVTVNCYFYMFFACENLTAAPELPATTLASNCYRYMFYGCRSLTTAPELPATALASGCYRFMFYGCTSLTTAPELPATTLAETCYDYMFGVCTSLTTAPALPATTLASYCYDDMFYNCTSLTTAPELPATTLASDCYSNMFGGCTSLTKAPALPATTLAENCYSNMFNGCRSLTTAPELPATTLATGCYKSMFRGCRSLTTAPELPATTLATGCYGNMFYDCTSLKISATQSSEYPTAWRIPSSGTISSEATYWNADMLSRTGGTFKSNPSINTTYYGAWRTPSHPITYTLSHCTGAGTNPTEIGDTEVTATFTADALYALPDTITVTNAEYTWNKSTGKLTLSNPTGDVSVTITAEIKPQNSVKLSSLAGWAAIPDGKHIIQIIAMGDEDLDSMPSAGVEITKTTVYTITATLSNVTADSTNPNTITASGYATLIFTAADGYKLPDTITVTGANYMWEQSTGVLDIYEPSANVAITITGTASQS